MNVADVGPFAGVACPTCGAEVRVKTEMGSYRLVRHIAHGGMSVIYAALDTTLNREIAPNMQSGQQIARCLMRSRHFDCFFGLVDTTHPDNSQ